MSASSKSVRRRPRDTFSEGDKKSIVTARHAGQARRRRMDEVEKISLTECLFTTSMETPYEDASTFAQGTMFTMIPNSSLDLLTFEFNAQTSGDMAVKVYYKEGDFSGSTNDESQWTKLADTVAKAAPGGQGAIIPAGEFTAASLDAGTTYSIYIHLAGGNNILKIHSSDSLIGDSFFTDDSGLLSLQVGVSLDTGPFPDSFAAPSEFAGRIHYKSTQDCDSVRTSTLVELQFAVNENPEAAVMESLSEAVQKSIDAVIILDPELIKYEKFHSLELEKVESAFMGRSEEKCPEDFDTCSLIFSRATFLHLPTITSGEVTLGIFNNEDQMAESVVSQSDFEAQFVGDPVFSVDFIITLVGVPAGTRMNMIQRRYFEVVTAEFLDGVIDIPIYATTVVDEVSEGSTNSRRLEMPLRLRGSVNRRLQGNGLQVVTTIFGSAPNEGEIRSSILEGIGGNADQYIFELASQQLRPGEINKDNSGAMFEDLGGTRIIVKPEDFGAPPPLPSTEAVDEEAQKENFLWICLCSAGIALSFIYLVYRVYKDFFYAPKEEMLKLDGTGSRRPSFEGRRPSFEGRRPSFERRPSIEQPLNDLSRSELSPPRNRAGENGRGVRPSRSMPMLRQPTTKKDSGADIKDDASNATSKSNSSRTPVNRAGDQRGIRPNKSLPMLSRQTVSDDRSVVSSASRQPPKNQAGQERGIKPSRSMPNINRPIGGKDSGNKNISDGSAHSRSSLAGVNKKNGSGDSKSPAKNKAGASRGVQPNRSLPMIKRVPVAKTSSDEGVPSSSGHSVGSVPHVQKHPPKNQAGASRGIKPSRSLPTVKKVPLAMNSSGEAIPSSSGHSVRSVPNIQKHPPKNRADQEIPSSSGHSVRSLPNLRKHPPEKKAGLKMSNGNGIPSSSGHSVKSLPGIRIAKHQPMNQAGKDPSLPTLKRLAVSKKAAPPTRKLRLDDGVESEEASDIESSEEQSSEESDFDDSAPVKPLSFKPPKKANSMPVTHKGATKFRDDDSESSEESDFEDYVTRKAAKYQADKNESKQIATKAAVMSKKTAKAVKKAPVVKIGDPISASEHGTPSSISGKSPKTAKSGGVSKKSKKSAKSKPDPISKSEHVPQSSRSVVSEKSTKSEVAGQTSNKSTKSKPTPNVSPKTLEKETSNQAGAIRGVTKSKSLPLEGIRKKIPLRDMVKKTDSDESSNEESDEDTIATGGPPRRIFKNSGAGFSARDDDSSVTSSITASISSRTPSKTANSTLEDSAGSAVNATAKDNKVLMIRNHLRDTSVQPVDLSSTLMRPPHLRHDHGMDTPLRLPERRVTRSKSAELGKAGKIKVNSEPPLATEGPSLAGGSKVLVPVKFDGVKKDAQPLGAKPIALKPVKVALQKDLGPPEVPPVAKQEVLKKHLPRSASFDGVKKDARPLGVKPIVLKPVKVTLKKDLRPPEVPPATKKEVMRGQLRRSASFDGVKKDARPLGVKPIVLKPVKVTLKKDLRPPEVPPATKKEVMRGQLRRSASFDGVKKDARPLGVKPIVLKPVKVTLKKDLRPPEVPPATKKEVMRGQLRRSASDERRGAIAAHLKDILGDEGSLPP